ncbi:hypothetical protein V1478_017239, partial [Vespula squamosa]
GLLINGGIHLTPSCYSWSSLLLPPPGHPLSYSVASERCRSNANDRLPASPAKTICNPTNRAQRLRDLSGSLAVRDINCFWLEPFTDRGPGAAKEFRSPVKARSLTAITLYRGSPLLDIPSLYGGNLQGSVKRQLTRALRKFVYYEEARFHVPRVSCKNRVHLVATIGNTRSCEHKPVRDIDR